GISELSVELNRRHSNGLKTNLRRLGVLANKHIPDIYLRGSLAQRRALLAGLLDTDGYCGRHGEVAFTVTNERLARGALDLALGLGYKATLRARPCPGRAKDTSTAYTVRLRPHEPVFRVKRKMSRQLVIRAASPARQR